MAIKIIPCESKYVREGIAFPQEDELDEITGDEFFKAQSFTGLTFPAVFVCRTSRLKILFRSLSL